MATTSNQDPAHSLDFAQSQAELRTYQRDGIAAIRSALLAGAARVLFVAPTGSGKTVIFAYIIAAASKRGKRILIIVHRIELIDQVAAALAGISYGVIAPGYLETDAPVQIASVSTIARRLGRWRDWADFVVVDEAHHAIAGSWATVLASQPRAHVLGVTATPERLDGRGLAEVFDEMVLGPSTAELIEAGWLCGYLVYEPAQPPDLSCARIRGGDYAIEDVRSAVGAVVIAAAVKEYLRLCPNVPAVALCIDVAHSKALAEALSAAGIRAVHLDGKTPVAERRAAIEGLADGRLDIICNCGLISEGVDVPAIGAILMLRPTASLALHLQQVGRTLRPAPGKERALILDFVGNVRRHGLPDAAREWSLDAKPRRQRTKAAAPRLRKCAVCSALHGPGAHECAGCGADLRTPTERREIEVRLEQDRRGSAIARLRHLPRGQQVEWAGADERRLQLVADMNGYKRGWVFYQRRRVLSGAGGAI
jgi:superfamily II DNA or RNA helicase